MIKVLKLYKREDVFANIRGMVKVVGGGSGEYNFN
jgi:hypothetical protein